MSDNGTEVERAVDVAVVGAGLAGLAAAAVAAREGARVALLDVRSPGGRARSDERDGFILNQGPHALYNAGTGMAVLGRLGVTVHGAPPGTRVAGYRDADGSFDLLPTSAGTLLRTSLVGPVDKLRLGRFLTSLPRLDAAALADRSAADWISSLGFGPGGSALVSALVRVAAYSGDLHQLSADAAAGQLQLALGANVLYLDGGWQTLVDGLLAAASTAGVQLRPGERVTAVRPAGDGSVEVTTAAVTLRASAVVLAAGGPEMARALLPDPPAWAVGPPATAACLDLGLRWLPERKVAFGLDEPLYLSTHSPSARLAPEGGVMVHVMRYGARTSADDRAQLERFAARCGVADGDVAVRRFLHKMVPCQALPRPGDGLAGRPAVDHTGLPGAFLAGDWVGPEGMLADAALASGESAGWAAARHASRVAAPGRVAPAASDRSHPEAETIPQ